jgi:heavy metal sensor kinase
MTGEYAEMYRLRWLLVGCGGAVMVLGLAGGWWFSTRAMRPLENISSAADKIATGDLSQRISVADTDNELGKLAAVLNSTFARLEAAFGQQRQFTSDAAHELRTPVSVVLTQIQTALNRERSAPEYRQTLETCQRATQRMRKLIESLLDLAHFDAGQERLKRLPFDLSQTARECAEMIRPLAEARGIKVVLEMPSLECVGDSERISRVITNLLANAVDHNHVGGEIRVRGECWNGAACLTVSDTGQGIPAEDLPHLFKRFYRADKARSAGHAGLGLAISKAIIEAHGGSISVSSEVGSGTAFRIELPR